MADGRVKFLNVYSFKLERTTGKRNPENVVRPDGPGGWSDGSRTAPVRCADGTHTCIFHLRAAAPIFKPVPGSGFHFGLNNKSIAVRSSSSSTFLRTETKAITTK